MSIASERCRRRIRRALPILACALALTACATSSGNRPGAGLLLPCQDPELVRDPDNASAEEINVERIEVAKAYANCKRRHADLATFVMRTTR